MLRTLRITVLLALACCTTRPDGPPSTHTSSSAFSTLPEKVAFLERYVSFRRHYQQLEYGVFYQNNAQGLVPGPSDWDITIVARVPADELDAWTRDMKRVESQPPELVGLASELDTHGIGEWYEALGKVVGVDRAARVVMYRASSR